MARPEIKTPIIHPLVIEYLEDQFNIDSLLAEKFSNNDEQTGYIKGTRAVIGHLNAVLEEQKGDED